jgi:hypothetical protein
MKSARVRFLHCLPPSPLVRVAHGGRISLHSIDGPVLVRHEIGDGEIVGRCTVLLFSITPTIHCDGPGHAKHKMASLYPVWGRDTSQLIRDFIGLGFKTAIVCVDPAKLDPSFVGRVIDEELLAKFPLHVDPCGENGEFHTFVFDGPIFKNPVKFSFGEIVCRDSFWFCDLLPAE